MKVCYTFIIQKRAVTRFSFGSMAKKKQTASLPELFRRSDRSHLFLAIFFSISLGAAVSLAVFEKSVEDDVSHTASPPSPFEVKLRTLVAGHPIERMVPYIAASDRDVATFLVAIAKKESDWGMHSPQKDGKSCYNYWGYRGPENTTDSGYSCFGSPGDAVHAVAARLRSLLDQGVDTPRELVVWKRGFLDTSLDSSEEKWVTDVAYYADKISKR